MSTVLSMSFVPINESDYPKIYRRLSNWIEKYADSFNLKEITNTVNYSSNDLGKVEPIDILSSSKAVVGDFFLTRYKPLEIRGGLWLYGEKYNGGYPSREDGSVKISLDERDIWGGLYRNGYLEAKEYEKARDHEISVLFEISEFFNELVVICADLIQYASLYNESGIPTSFTSSMVFFRDYRQIVKEYQRVYIESRSDKPLLDFFTLEGSDYVMSDDIINKTYYEGFTNDRDGSLLDFLESLGTEEIHVLSKLKEDTIAKSLKEILACHTDIIFYEAKFGYTLATYPFMGLWPLYKDLLNKLVLT